VRGTHSLESADRDKSGHQRRESGAGATHGLCKVEGQNQDMDKTQAGNGNEGHSRCAKTYEGHSISGERRGTSQNNDRDRERKGDSHPGRGTNKPKRSECMRGTQGLESGEWGIKERERDSRAE
jgi:hypothetical protein